MREWKDWKDPRTRHRAIFAAVMIVGAMFFFFMNRTMTVTKYPEPTANFFVEDYSGVLNEETEQYIFQQAVSLYKATTAQVVVVTVPDTHKDSLEVYSRRLANRWGIGDKKLNNGILLLFTTDESDPHVRLEVGRGLEGRITDGKAGRMLDLYAVKDKDSGRWNKAAGNTFTEIVKELYEEYEIACPDDLKMRDFWQDGKVKTKGTFADATFPTAEKKKNTNPLHMQLAYAAYEAFMVFMLLETVRGIWGLIVILTGHGKRRGGGYSGGYYGNDYTGGGGSSDGGGGYSGGGGSFDGGGASR